MKVIIFIQAVSAKEWEVGEIIQQDIAYNPDFTNICSKVLYAKNLKTFSGYMQQIEEKLSPEDEIFIQVDAHANSEAIAFKDVNNTNPNEYEYVKWEKLQVSLDKLYEKFGNKILLIFLSCYSYEYFSGLKSPHIKIMAAEGEVNPRRGEEQLIYFYNNYCNGYSVETSFEKMQSKFPRDKEVDEKNGKAIFHLLVSPDENPYNAEE